MAEKSQPVSVAEKCQPVWLKKANQSMCLKNCNQSINQGLPWHDWLDAVLEHWQKKDEWIAWGKDMLAKYFGGASLAEIGGAFKRLDLDNSADLSWSEFVHGARALLH